MPTQTSPAGLKYHLIAFDASGNERTDDPNGKMSDKILAALHAEPVTDVFLMSHGWQGDVPSALRQYNAWIDAMAKCTDDRAAIARARPGFHPLLVGFHWPSLAWGNEELGGGGNVSFGAPGESPVDDLVEKYAERLADTPAARTALRTVIESALNNIAPDELPSEVRAAYITLNAEAGLAAGDVDGDPSADRAPFDPDRVYEAEQQGVSFGWPSLGGLLAPLRTLTFWKMKDRAKAVGETAGFRLLAQIQQASPKARVHLMGHSFGCIVVSSTLAGPGGNGQLVRPVNTLVLLQGALSLWSFCSDIPSKPGSAGFFRSVVSAGKVSGPILTSISAKDTAVGRYYPIAAGARGDVQFAPGTLPKFGGIGSFGARGPGLNIVDLDLQPANYAYQFQPGHIYNIESTKYICEGGGTAGAHSDIAKPEVAHAFWCAVM